MSGISDWEECCHIIPVQLGQLWECPSTRGENSATCFWLESVSWKVSVDMGQQRKDASIKLRAMHNYLSMLEVDEGEDPTGDSEGWIGRLSREVCLQEQAITDIAKRLNDQQWSGQPCIRSISKELIPGMSENNLNAERAYAVRSLSMPEPAEAETDVVLQTKSVPADLVRNEIQKWRPAMQDEYDSLVAKTDAVKPLSDEEF